MKEAKQNKTVASKKKLSNKKQSKKVIKNGTAKVIVKKGKKKQKRRLYNENNIKYAVTAVSEGMSIRKAARAYGIPVSTLGRKKNNPTTIKPDLPNGGPGTVLNREEEEKIANCIIARSRIGYPMTKIELLDSVQKYVVSTKMETPFINSRPGRHWYEGFRKRHPKITIRTPQQLSYTRAAVTQDVLREWFTEQKSYLESKELLNISADRIFNCDESSLCLSPDGEKVLTEKGSQSVYTLSDASKECLTVLFMYSAAGVRAPPLLMFAYKKEVPDTIVKKLPTGWGVGLSDNGWMTAESFFEYITNVFYPWLVKNETKFPVVIYLDNHASHITIPLVAFCREKQIEIIGLPPNSTHITQPLDVAFFHPFKIMWKKTLPKWKSEQQVRKIKKEDFSVVLHLTLKSMKNEASIIQSGFRKCGLFPFNPQEIDYNVLQKKKKNKCEQMDKCVIQHTEDNLKFMNDNENSHLSTFEQNLSPELLNEFYQADPNNAWNGSIEHQSLFDYWLKIGGSANEGALVDHCKIQSDTEITSINTETTDSNDSSIRTAKDSSIFQNNSNTSFDTSPVASTSNHDGNNCTPDSVSQGELYVEDLGERRFVSIRMGWLWVEGTPMRLALRALNLRQAEPSICQPHALALGFTLSDSKDDPLATFWTDTEPTWWSWVRAIAAEIVRQTPFRAQRCLNFLGILTTCPRGPVPLPDSPTEQRRRSRSELRYWPTADLSIEKISPDQHSPSILEESRRRARSELRAWSSSNTSSDEDLLLGGSVTAANVTGGGVVVGVVVSASGGVHNSSTGSRAWGCSESSEGSDDSLPWGAGGPCCRSSVDSVDSAISLSEPSTREQRMQRYKEARRRENEARRRQVLEEDARRRWANKAVGPCVNTLATVRKSEENNNHNDDEGVDSSYRASRHRRSSSSKATRTRLFANVDDHDDNEVPLLTSPKTELTRVISSSSSSSSSTSSTNSSRIEDAPGSGKYSSPVKPQTDTCSTVRFENTRQQQYDDNWNNNNNNNSNNKNHSSNKNSDSVSRNNQLNSSLTKLGILKTDAALERRSRARERRNVRDKGPQLSLPAVVASAKPDVETLKERKERLNSTTAAIARSTTALSSSAVATKLPEIPMECCISQQQQRQEQQYRRSVSLSVLQEQQPPPCEEDVARLLKRCQRVDHYVPVRDKLTLFESLTRMAGRLARSTEDLCRTCNSSNPSPKGKQRARSLHDLNRGGVKLVPVREMCRFFENGKASSYTSVANATLRKETTRGRPCELGAPINGAIKSFREPPRNPNAPCIRTSTRRKHYAK